MKGRQNRKRGMEEKNEEWKRRAGKVKEVEDRWNENRRM